MKAIITDIPDPAEWPRWLEKRIVGIDLYDLVVGLKATQKLGEASEIYKLDQSCGSDQRLGDVTSELYKLLNQICGSQLEQIYVTGLNCLSTEQLRTIFNNPDLLIILQEQVLIHGGSYWDQVEPDDDAKKARADSLKKLLADINQEGTSSAQVELASRKKGFVESNWHWLVLAASVLFLIASWSRFPSESGGGWGFDKSGLLTAQVDGKTYLGQLATAAGAFQKKVPDSREATLQRLVEFRAGCKKLIAAPNNQLTNPVDRKWLVDKCRDWLVEIEGHVTDLEQDSKPWQDVLKEAAQTAKQMESVLRDKSTEIVG